MSKSLNKSSNKELARQLKKKPIGPIRSLSANLKDVIGLIFTIIKYFSGIGLLILEINKLIPIVTGGQKADWMSFVMIFVPLVLVFFLWYVCEVRPKQQRRREQELQTVGIGKAGYFTTAPREIDAEGFFLIGYDTFLNWLSDPKCSLLHLSGLSGSGKSSLLSAYLKPRLEALVSPYKTTLLIIRSCTDPLGSLKQELLSLWKNKPDDYDSITPLEALVRASRMNKQDRILVAFDQFEEFFLLRSTESKSRVPIGNGFLTDEITLLRKFLTDFEKSKPPRVSLLFCYREDYYILLSPLHLPARIENENHMIVQPLEFSTAAKFLNSCPGLAVPENRLKLILSEAAAHEGSRVVMRPIVANLFGIILQRMANHPTLWTRTTDLLRGYVRDTLGVEMAEERSKLLRALLTDFHTVRPRTLSDLVAETGVNIAHLESELEKLKNAGLLRTLHTFDTEQTKRIWQISHDFLATLIERVLDGVQSSIWHKVRPWLLSATLITTLIVTSLLWPYQEKLMSIKSLAEVGYTWNEKYKKVEIGTVDAHSLEDFSVLSAPLLKLQPISVDVDGSFYLKNLNFLIGLTNIQDLDISFCKQLQDLDGLKGLTTLQTLRSTACVALKNIEVLKNLPNLHSLYLTSCISLEGLNVLEGNTSLTNLDIRNCNRVQNLHGLSSLINLQTITLGEGIPLPNVDDLKGLKKLKMVIILRSTELQNIDGLTGDINLEHLEIVGCPALQNIDGLIGNFKIKFLDLGGCTALKNISGLRELYNLENLTLSGCPIDNGDDLKKLKNLLTLDLSGCTALKEVNGLTNLTKLVDLNLRGCSRLYKHDLDELKTTLPHTSILLPDGSKEGPPPKFLKF